MVIYNYIHAVNFEALVMIANNELKFNNLKDACLLNLNCVLYHAFPLNIYEHW